MVVLLEIHIVGPHAGMHVALRKETREGTIPPHGAFIADGAWTEPRVPTKVTIDYTANHCLLDFLPEHASCEDHCSDIENEYRNNGWVRAEQYGLRYYR